jgi:hypothetical protein
MNSGESQRSPVEERFSVAQVLIDRIQDLKETIEEVSSNLQKLIYYVIAIGALNGSITVGKIVEGATSSSTENSQYARKEIDGGHNNVEDTRKDRPREGQSKN